MPGRTFSKRIARSLCGEVHRDDGIDPKWESRGRSRGKCQRKARQLCQQVAETLSFVLGGGSDDSLDGLVVLGVEPSPDTTRLLVTVAAGDAETVDPTAILEALERDAPRLRNEVAGAITRRKAPVLAFQLALRTDDRPRV
jgi:ribosome-binding factor A